MFDLFMYMVIWIIMGGFTYGTIVHMFGDGRGIEGFWKQFEEWQKAYMRRRHADPETNYNYPQYRRDERWEAQRVVLMFRRFLIIPFWPVAIIFAILRGIASMFRPIWTLAGSVFKLADSLKGE